MEGKEVTKFSEYIGKVDGIAEFLEVESPGVALIAISC